MEMKLLTRELDIHTIVNQTRTDFRIHKCKIVKLIVFFLYLSLIYLGEADHFGKSVVNLSCRHGKPRKENLSKWLLKTKIISSDVIKFYCIQNTKHDMQGLRTSNFIFSQTFSVVIVINTYISSNYNLK